MPTSGTAGGREGDSNTPTSPPSVLTPPTNSPTPTTTTNAKQDLLPPTNSPTTQQPTSAPAPAPSPSSTASPNTSQTTSSNSPTSAAASKSQNTASSSTSTTSQTSNANTQTPTTPVDFATTSGTNTYRGPTTASSFSSSSVSTSASSTPSGISGGHNTIIFGSVVGTLAVLVVFGIFCSHMRRRSRRSRRRKEEALNAAASAATSRSAPNLEKPDFNRQSTFDPTVPAGLAQLHRYDSISRPSLSSIPTNHSGYSSYNSHRGLARAPSGPSQPQYAQDPGYGPVGLAVSTPAYGMGGVQPSPQFGYPVDPFGTYGFPQTSPSPVSSNHGLGVPSPTYPNLRASIGRPIRRDSGPIPTSLVPGTANGRGPSALSVYDDRDAYGGF